MVNSDNTGFVAAGDVRELCSGVTLQIQHEKRLELQQTIQVYSITGDAQ